ncbi:MAG: acetolactate synthase [Phycisphaerae bacterium]|nr:acetolactate synthase [Phycisphaerae bacterium]
MSQATPPSLDTELGYAPPTVRQFSVFLDNRVGKLLELVRFFDESNVTKLAAFSIVDSSDYAVVRAVFSNADAARQILRRNNYTFSETDIVVAELGENQSVAAMCSYLLGAELNIRFVYPLFLRGDNPGVVIAVDDIHLAGQILLRKRFRLLAEEDLG